MAEQDYFEAHLAVAPGSVETVPGAVAQVYAVEDVNFQTPLGITNLDGTPMPNLRANQFGVYPPFRVMTGEWQVVARSGGVSTPMMSVQGPARAVAAQLADEVSAAETARDAAQLAQAEAEAAAEQATAPTEQQVLTLVSEPGPVKDQLSATIDETVGPLVPPLVAAAIADDETIRQAAAGAVAQAVEDENLMVYGIPLGTADLDTITTPSVYFQATQAEATAARHYPVVGAVGVLEVHAEGFGYLQRFTMRDGTGQTATTVARGQYVRAYSGGSWTPWRFIPSQRVDQTAGRAIYTWDDVNNREQLIYGDTGWRDVTALLLNGWTATAFRVRRVNYSVEVYITGLSSQNATADSALSSLGGGWRATGNMTPPVSRSDGITYLGWTSGTGAFGMNRFRTGTTYEISFSYPTADPWPTTLPGVAFGGIPS